MAIAQWALPNPHSATTKTQSGASMAGVHSTSQSSSQLQLHLRVDHHPHRSCQMPQGLFFHAAALPLKFQVHFLGPRFLKAIFQGIR